MTKEKNWGQSVLGWFVVNEEASSTEPVEESPASADAGPPLQVEPVEEPPRASGGVVDYPGVFDAYGVPAEDRERFEKAASLLRTLPEGTDPVVKRQIVAASLTAFGIPVERIIEAGVGEIQALDGYQKKGAADTAGVSQEIESLIAGFEGKIREARALLEGRLKEQLAVQASCNQKKLEIQKVLEFFGQEAVSRVVRESPKLIDPGASRSSPETKS